MGRKTSQPSVVGVREFRQNLSVCLDRVKKGDDRAAIVDPPLVRSLDAIHVATALSIAEPGLEIITYDGHMAEAALASGLRVVQPGR